MNKPNSVIKISTTLDSFFETWLILLNPYHHLTPTQMKVAAQFLKLRYELSKVITDNGILDEYLKTEESHRKVREACKVSPQHFQVIMGDLRRNKFFIDKNINPRYIPKLEDKPKEFSLLFYFAFEK